MRMKYKRIRDSRRRIQRRIYPFIVNPFNAETMVFKPAGRLGVFLDTQTLHKHPSGHPDFFVRNSLKC